MQARTLVPRQLLVDDQFRIVAIESAHVPPWQAKPLPATQPQEGEKPAGLVGVVARLNRVHHPAALDQHGVDVVLRRLLAGRLHGLQWVDRDVVLTPARQA